MKVETQTNSVYVLPELVTQELNMNTYLHTKMLNP